MKISGIEKHGKKAYEWGDKDLAKKMEIYQLLKHGKPDMQHMLQYSEYHEDFGSCAEIQIIFGTVRESESGVGTLN